MKHLVKTICDCRHLLPPGSDSEAQSESARLTRASDAFKLLSKSLDRHMQLIRRLDPRHADRFCSLDYYLRMLGKVSLVSVEIEIVNPLNEQLHELLQDESVRCAIGEELAAAKRILYGNVYLAPF
ncbi:DNA recombination, putative [Babesia ovata]|uniref:DNA recombination, putative n=1 Tax=Babesia ovata TaxID=189622 RepID=A0A2H6K9B0_9APIC|nr:DNA recombination, putative [Babesia ovata]GBE59571.1 DNA recombination, putative [Babesia ovata]